MCFREPVNDYLVRYPYMVNLKQGGSMVTAIVMLTVERDKIDAVAQEIAEIKEISEVFSVGGRIDLIAIMRCTDNESMADIVTGRLLKVQGIISSETMIAFKVYSRHDLEAMFSVGM